MDSFYDAPRPAPVPTRVEKFLVTPVVPEVSMLCTSKTPVNNYTSYNTWRMQQNCNENLNVLSSNRVNMVNGPQHSIRPSQANTSQFLKKQVRFESPVLQQRPSLTYEPFSARKTDVQTQNTVSKPSGEKLFDDEFPLNGKTFEQIYMANVPNRHLDLSIIDIPNKPKNVEVAGEKENEKKIVLSDAQSDKENELPKTYQEFLKTQKKVNKVNADDSVTDIFNYKRNKAADISKHVVRSAKEHKENIIDPRFKQMLYQPPSVFSKSNQNEISVSPKPDSNVQNFHNHGIERPSSPLCANYQCDYPVFQHNYPQNSPCLNRMQNFGRPSPRCDGVTQTNVVCNNKTSQKTKDDSEPSNKDLLKIIAQQNEQLLILQKQVAMLLNRDQNQPKQIEGPPHRGNCLGEKCVTSTQNENFNNPITDINNTPRKRGMSKFSIDLMTSFEVAIRPQQNKQNFMNHEPKIQEITETESVTTAASSMNKNEKIIVDTSLHLQEPVRVQELCPSPEPSININMNDYDSSDEDEVSASEIGATFYRNLMDQVNNILKKAKLQTNEALATRDRKKGDIVENIKDRTMSRVKEATLKHLRNIGVTIGPLDDIDESASPENDSKDYSPTEISFAVKQILMKYLPDEHLAKVTYKRQSVPKTKEINPGIISARPDFSFASVQYMKKYNLISSTSNANKPVREVPQTPKPLPQQSDNPKILDITALKMQPKLL